MSLNLFLKHCTTSEAVSLIHNCRDQNMCVLNLAITTEAMGIWRFVGAFAVVGRQSECGSKTSKLHVREPMDIECVGSSKAFHFNCFVFINEYDISLKPPSLFLAIIACCQ